MVFVVVQIKCRLKIVKTWYGCLIPDSCTLSDLYNDFSAGQLDRSLPLLDEYLGATVESFAGRTKTDLIRVNSQCAVGEVVGSLGQYVEFCLTQLDGVGNARGDTAMIQSPSFYVGGATESAFDVLMRGALERSNLPGKWKVEAPVNKKLELKIGWN